MKRIVLIVLLMSFITCIFAEFLTLAIYPSATDAAFGNFSGAANLWNRNPLDVMSNPAKLGFFKGVSYAFSSDDLYENYSGYDLKYSNSYLSLGWNGIGVLFPVTSGELEYNSYYTEETEDCKNYAIGINLIQFFKKGNIGKLKELGRNQKYEISLGLAYLKLKKENYKDYYDDYTRDISVTTFNLGAAILYRPLIIDYQKEKGLGVDLVLAFNSVNPFNSTYEDYECIYNLYTYKYDHEIFKNNTIAGSCRFSYHDRSILNMDTLLTHKVNNLFSVYLSVDFAREYFNNYASTETNAGYGAELTILDLISIRKGITDSRRIDGSECWGIGLNYSFYDYASLQFNYAETPDNGSEENQERTDYMVNLNVLKIIESLEKR
ncbi:MAG: hypothetical protein PHR06_01415 [Candidatus Cloacimonetes bacterium]|nr:hypothetical protein [Candidatus Cloacimonadota bacterium]